MTIALKLLIFIPLLALICLVAIWRKISSRKLKGLIWGLIGGIILFEIGIWVGSLAFCGGGSQGEIIYFLAHYFIVGFILGLFLYWVYQLINKYLKVSSVFLKVFMAIFFTIILAYGLNELLNKFLGMPILGSVVDLFKMLDFGGILTPLFRFLYNKK